ncbi:MAG TPA: hypothetical protein VGZ51_00690, partial [Actinomycetota bacterium]|nr:hypothetical protein [Actinomycetota bacterium]
GWLLVSASRDAGNLARDVDALFEARRPGTGGGSKIGLYVSRRVAEAQGGRAWGELSDGRLTFHVEMPIAGRDSLTP